ncbi:MAG TPA: M48 family metallopeptidase [Methylomirabilota bacterium]|nr:M48 family metallopeptidase [Methylomirabilota bacterium]
MKGLRRFLLGAAVWLALVPKAPAIGPLQLPTASEAAVAQSEAARQKEVNKVTKYTLPPGRYKQARDLARIYSRMRFVGFFYGLAVLWLLLRWKISARLRNIAERVRVRFGQAAIFAVLLSLTIGFLDLPLGMYQHWISRQFGLSVQGWASWFRDAAKGELLGWIPAVLFVWILYAVIRASPRRWWFYFWLASLPILLLLVFLQPLVVDPLFHKFEPLAQKDPALTESLERMVHRAGQSIPPERMFWMGASEKTTALNAYVTGFGASKRIVVWDTTIAKMTTPQITYVAGHEMGHYVLQHIPKGLVLGAAFLLVPFYLGYRTVGWILSRWGANWGVRELADWASLPVLLLLLSVFAFLADPVVNGASRYLEHQADQYGLEVTHGLTPDSGQIAAQSFQVLGETNLADPEPSRLKVWLFYDHPAIPDRVRFALSYDPWSKGEQGEFVK